MDNKSMQPVPAAERIGVIDALRGFAIFGILVVNVLYFFNPLFASMVEPASPLSDHVVKFVTNTFFDSKFYTIFSFLFGLGMYIQWSRAQAKEARFLPVYLRRLLILAAFGVAHGVLLWTGDILLLYAVVGTVAALFFLKRSAKTLLVWAIVLIALPLLFVTASAALLELARLAPLESGAWEDVQQSFAAQLEMIEAQNAAAVAAYSGSSWMEATRYRLNEFFGLGMTARFFVAPTVLGMFLLGIRAGQRKWFSDIDGHLPLFRGMVRWGLPIGLAFSLFVGLTGFEQNMLGTEVFTWMDAAQVTALSAGGVLLALSYISLIVLWSRTATGAKLLSPFESVGRMALTNYILQSLVMSTLAYGYGFGLFNEISLTTGLLLALALYILQVPSSRWWLSRRRFGPLEWFWRLLTYARPVGG